MQSKKKCFWMVLGIGLSVWFLFFYPSMRVLRLVPYPADTPLGYIRVSRGETFTLGFIHSVNRRPVWDTLRIEENGLVIVSSRFDAFGAGMPETTNAEGTLWTLSDGTLLWTVNRPVPSITLRIGWTADHTLTIRGKTLRLAQLVEPGKALTLDVYTMTLFETMKGNRLL